MNIDQIMKQLPHRYPFLMVDKIVELEKGKRAVAIKNVTINEPFFQGHYPEMPVMPGVMIIEAMAQAGGLAAGTIGDELVPLFTAIDKARFRGVVKPGDQIIITANVIQARSTAARVNTEARVDGELVATGELMFVLTKRGAIL